MKHPVYARIEDSVIQRLKLLGEEFGESVSSIIENLVIRGLSVIDTEDSSKSSEAELAQLKESSRVLEQEQANLRAKVVVSEKNESLARSAREQAELTKSQFEQMLGVAAAKCGRPKCSQVWRLYDVWHHQCPKCGGSTAKLLSDYAPAPTVGEGARDVLAVVGGVTALVALLKAMGGGSEGNGTA